MDNLKIILQARTGSSRLPKKMIMPFYDDKSVLTLLLERLLRYFCKEDIIVATTIEESDDKIEELVHNLKIPVFRGSENDVLQRFIDAAGKYKADKLIRICADNLFLDIDSLVKLIDIFKTDNVNDYVSFSKSDGTPSIKTHYGFWAEAVRLDALRKVVEQTDEKIYHEHVTNYIYTHPDLFKFTLLRINPEIEKKQNLRLTLDTEEDFKVQQYIYCSLMKDCKDISPENIIQFIDENRNLYKIMHNSIIANTK